MQIAKQNAPANAVADFGALWARITDYAAVRRRFRETLTELQQLSDRELTDLGMSRASLRSIAWEAAQKG